MYVYILAIEHFWKEVLLPVEIGNKGPGIGESVLMVALHTFLVF